MEKDIKISVIIPVYNCQEYITKCLDSFVSQDFKDIEIICVNDGSKDNTLEVLKKYIEHHKKDRIILIDKENAGVWYARIDGIKKARGDYIVFCDSDDYVERNYLSKMYNKIKEDNSDISICGFYRVNSKNNKPYSIEMITKKEDIYFDKNIEEIISVNTALWNKIYKKEILNGVSELKDPPRVLEDMMFLALVYQNVNKITFLPEPLYYYIVNSTSAMASTNARDIEKTEKAMIKVKEIYSKNKCKKELMEILDCMAFLHFGISLMFRLSYTENKNFKKLFKNNKEFLNNNFNGYKKSKYLKIVYVLKRKSSNLKITIMKKIYSIGMFGIFLKVYRFMIDKLKIDIKW